MGQPVLVENRAGAGGTLAAAEVARPPPDGYTMLIHNVTFPIASVAAALANRATYNVDTDFAGVSIAVYVPFVWTAQSGACRRRTCRSWRSCCRSDRSLHYTYGSTGPGSFMHVLGEAFSARGEGRDDARPVQGRGAAQAGTDRRPPTASAATSSRPRSRDISRRQAHGARDQRVEAHRRAARRADGARARLPDARGGRLERLLRAGEDAARGRRPAAA